MPLLCCARPSVLLLLLFPLYLYLLALAYAFMGLTEKRGHRRERKGEGREGGEERGPQITHTGEYAIDGRRDFTWTRFRSICMLESDYKSSARRDTSYSAPTPRTPPKIPLLFELGLKKCGISLIYFDSADLLHHQTVFRMCRLASNPSLIL